MAASAQALPWRAQLELEFALRGARTRLTAQHHYGPLLVQRPFHPEAVDVCHAYLIHPPAGVVGGDELHLNVHLHEGAQTLLTTPSATRFYRSAQRISQLRQTFSVADGASLEWLPQENLLFDGARARITTTVLLTGAARFCGWEMLGLGRPACGEGFEHGLLDQSIALYRDDQPLLLERLRPPLGQALRAGGAGLRGHASCLTWLATGANTLHLDAARAILSTLKLGLASATLLDDLLVCRVFAAQTAPLHVLCERLWQELRPALLAREAHAPRIWST
jgi:urease accessory protein